MGAVDTTYTFTATDTITSTKMNNIIDQTTMTSDAIIGTTLDVSTGKLKVRAAGITSNELATASVTSNAILDGTIVDADINASANILGSKLSDNSVPSVKLVDSSILPAKLAQPLTLDTSKTASGTSVDFTGIPSWVKKVTIMFSAISTNGTSIPIVRLGTTAGLETSNYLGAGWTDGSTALNHTSGFLLAGSHGANSVLHGQMQLCLLDSNLWSEMARFGLSNLAILTSSAGTKSLSGSLDRLRITTTNGTDAFDSGTINIMYE